MIIEEMKLDDLDRVMEIENDVFSNPWSKESFKNDLLLNPCSTYYLLKDGERIVGYAGLNIMYEDGEILNIAIAKEFQGKHLGDLLLNFLIDEAKNKGCQRLHLEVRKSNLVAYNLYKKKDFKEIRIRKNYYGLNEDGIDMMKGLE